MNWNVSYFAIKTDYAKKNKKYVIVNLCLRVSQLFLMIT